MLFYLDDNIIINMQSYKNLFDYTIYIFVMTLK